MAEHAPTAADPPAGDAKTSDVYHVNDNLPERFNNPAKFRGYSRKFNPLYQTSNQAYGSKQPSVHDMPTTFFSRHNKFSEQQLKSGMYQNNSFNTALDKTRISEDNRDAFYDRVNFHCLYRAQAKPR